MGSAPRPGTSDDPARWPRRTNRRLEDPASPRPRPRRRTPRGSARPGRGSLVGRASRRVHRVCRDGSRLRHPASRAASPARSAAAPAARSVGPNRRGDRARGRTARSPNAAPDPVAAGPVRASRGGRDRGGRRRITQTLSIERSDRERARHSVDRQRIRPTDRRSSDPDPRRARFRGLPDAGQRRASAQPPRVQPCLRARDERLRGLRPERHPDDRSRGKPRHGLRSSHRRR